MLLALLIWRLMERTMRRHIETTGTALTGWDKKATERPTSFMMVTKFAGVIVLKRGHHRQLAHPLSVIQQQYLSALDVPVACFTVARPLRREEGGLRHASHSDQSGFWAGGPPTTSGRKPGAAAATRNWCAPSKVIRARSARAFAPGKARRWMGHWPLVWRESGIPEAHPRGSEMGLPIRRKL